MPRKRRRTASSADDGGGYWFDAETADAACEFVERLVRHWKGEWAGQPFRLLPWQREIIRDVWGWKRPDGTRKYRTVSIWVPKKNGKTALAAAMALLLLFLDGEAGAEVYSAAGDRKQAELCFMDARNFVVSSRELAKRSMLFTRRILYPRTKGWYEALSADAPTKHGFNVYGLIFDELHVQPNRELWDTLRLGTVARRQPLTISISTAGVYDEDALWWQEWQYALAVIRSRTSDAAAKRNPLLRDVEPFDDPSHYAVIYAAKPDADPWSEKTWKEANPSLGHTLKVEALRDISRKAQQNPAEQAAFKRLHLNIPSESTEGGVDMDAWRTRCAGELRIEDGMECWVGMDLSSKLDLTAVVAVFVHEDGTFDVLPKFWLPAENLAERARLDVFDYPRMVRDGYLEATEGNWVDQRAIREYIRELGDRYPIRQIGFDSWNASQMATWLQDEDGFEVVELRQGTRTMSEPSKLLAALVKDGRIRHANHPVLRWNAANLTFRRDPNDNWAPRKDRKGRKRIDGMVALIMGLRQATLGDEDSPYDNRGVLVI